MTLGGGQTSHPRTPDATAGVSDGPERLSSAPTLGHGRAVTMTDFAAQHRRRARERESAREGWEGATYVRGRQG